jgi:hypothetical protein
MKKKKGPFDRACKRAEALFTAHGFKRAQRDIANVDCYVRYNPNRAVNTMLRAFVTRADFGVKLEIEEGNEHKLLCNTSDLAEVENILRSSPHRLGFPRKHRL